MPVHGRGHVLHEDARDLLDSCLERSLLSVAILRGAARQLARRPGRSLRAFRLLLGSRSPRILLKNLAVLPKGLWLGLEAERRRIDHIHAHWGATSSTLALIASRLSGIPWSVTVHRWDIDENNLLAAKARSAAFVRAINEIGLRKLAAATGAVTGDAFVLHMGVDVPAGLAPAGDGRPRARSGEPAGGEGPRPPVRGGAAAARARRRRYGSTASATARSGPSSSATSPSTRSRTTSC